MSIERLDVEDEEKRQHRLGELLQRINDSSSSNKDNNGTARSNNTPFIQPGPSSIPSSSSFDFCVRQTHAVEPPTELLSRVEAFLPQMEAANAELARRMGRSRERVDIEAVGENEEEYIEMNLGLGVFDIRRPCRQSSDSNSDTAASSSSSTTTEDDEPHSDDSDSDSDSGSSSDDASTSVIPGSSLQISHQRPIIPLPAKSNFHSPPA